MSVHDLWDGLPKAEIARRRQKNAVRWQRRWRGPDINPTTGRLAQHKQSYSDNQKPQALLDEAAQIQSPHQQGTRSSSVTVGTLLDRHLAAKADRAPKTIEADEYHASVVRDTFGDRVLSTIDATEIEIWSQRAEPAASSRKKQLELLRAAIKRGVRDNLVGVDVTEGLVVSLRHTERPYWSSQELRAVVDAASSDFDATMFRVLGFLGLRENEMRTLRVGDLVGNQLTVRDSKTRAGIRTLPVPASVLPSLVELAGSRPKADWLFVSPRRPGNAVSKGYANAALTRAVGGANAIRIDPIRRLSAHGLRHTFAAIALSEAGGNLLSVSRALGHARPSITLDRYGHLAPAGLEPLMALVDAFAVPKAA
ncbi:tyrosine-type recombinase/integrase [Microterricola pindariensis]|uniref:Tyr recombinase domain-containing protein n=1 Tax=Microterricola pindariensis TaxID=478010 RepID=A0ABX5AZP6_9MICO|nr:site-specific integrase [Microterricola pindariensis]PPL19804.1 hypothetical protein GY24_04085 [Microterricola pindariensis]